VHWLDFNKGILLLEMHGTNIKKMKGKLIFFYREKVARA
jgi:hypothetical protein